jgi:hypothetical protein
MRKNKERYDNDNSTSLAKFFDEPDEESAIEEREAEAARKEKEILEEQEKLMKKRRLAKLLRDVESMTLEDYYTKKYDF